MMTIRKAIAASLIWNTKQKYVQARIQAADKFLYYFSVIDFVPGW